MINSLYVFVCVSMLVLCFSQCTKDTQIPDVSAVNADFDLFRFEQALFSTDTMQVAPTIARLNERHSAFTELYFRHIVPLQPDAEGDIALQVKDFITYPTVRQLYDTTMLVFPDVQNIRQELHQAFRFYKYYFPERDVPDVYTFISEYSLQTLIFDNQGKDAVGIGLDMFLGADYPYRTYFPDNPNFSSYLTRTFDKTHLPRKVMLTLIDDLVGMPKETNLLTAMINNGKKMYLLEKMLPTTPDTVLWEYTAPQMQWCKENELQLWTHLLHEDLLYSTDGSKFRKLIDPSPRGPSDIPPESPGRAANFIGKKIVEAYMRRHPETSFSDLVAQKNAQHILDASRYRPPQ